MKLSCEVEVIYSLAVANGGINSKSSRCRSCVSLGKKPSTTKPGREELYLVVSTAKNVAGTKYKIRDNVSRVFSKCLSAGKATIKFKEPAHDLCISKADPAQLRELLNVIKLTPQQQKDSTIAPLEPMKLQYLEKPKAKLVVKSRGDYPMRGFPPSLVSFEAAGISLNRLDLRLLQLKHLQTLDLSNNTIKSLPEALKDTKLVELRLAGNKISSLPEVLFTGELASCLSLLDLSRNSLSALPNSTSHLKNLVQLKLDCNSLQFLPRTFGKLAGLKFLSASSNQIKVLPATFPRLSLESLDLFGNCFVSPGLIRKCSDLSLPTLKELAGRIIKKHRVHYDPYHIPVVLCHYLDSAKKCLCGKACFSSFLHYIAHLDLHKVSATVTAVDREGSTKVPVETFLCSARCLKLWKL